MAISEHVWAKIASMIHCISKDLGSLQSSHILTFWKYCQIEGGQSKILMLEGTTNRPIQSIVGRSENVRLIAIENHLSRPYRNVLGCWVDENR